MWVSMAVVPYVVSRKKVISVTRYLSHRPFMSVWKSSVKMKNVPVHGLFRKHSMNG